MPNDALPSVIQTGEIIALIKRIAGGGTWVSLATSASGWFGGLDYRKVGSLIVLRGNFTNAGGAAGVTLVTLPVGSRPGTNMIFDTFRILSTGAVSPSAAVDTAVSGYVFVQEN